MKNKGFTPSLENGIARKRGTKPMPFFSAGFTLIELLIVIGIVGVLSSVVIASLNTARAKGQDAKVKSQISGAKNAAASYISSFGDYGAATDACDNMFADVDSGMAAYTDTANYPPFVTAINCKSDSVAYAMSAPLSDGTFWCVDSTGATQDNASDLAAGQTTCNP